MSRKEARKHKHECCTHCICLNVSIVNLVVALQLKGLMEQDEEDEAQNPSAGENGEEGGGQDGDDVS